MAHLGELAELDFGLFGLFGLFGDDMKKLGFAENGENGGFGNSG